MKNHKLFWLFLFCLVLLVVRILKTDHYSFLFLIWNVFLAWLPYWIIGQHKHAQSVGARYAIIGLTILFLPNAPYILTDLFHLSKNLLAPMWFDLLLILSCSLLGLLLFILTIEQLFLMLGPSFKSRWWFNVAKITVILSNGYGIYLGRYLRFNSWDLLVHPDRLMVKMYQSLFNSNHYKETLAVTITFAIFLYLLLEIYEAFKKKIIEKQNELF